MEKEGAGFRGVYQNVQVAFLTTDYFLSFQFQKYFLGRHCQNIMMPSRSRRKSSGKQKSVEVWFWV
jgi:hypothetical protein